jgi:hypothetical protein
MYVGAAAAPVASASCCSPPALLLLNRQKRNPTRRQLCETADVAMRAPSPRLCGERASRMRYCAVALATFE